MFFRTPDRVMTHCVQNEFDMVYKDDLSISLSTAYLFNYPTIGFARLPVSLTISLSVFSCRVSFS